MKYFNACILNFNYNHHQLRNNLEQSKNFRERILRNLSADKARDGSPKRPVDKIRFLIPEKDVVNFKDLTSDGYKERARWLILKYKKYNIIPIPSMTGYTRRQFRDNPDPLNFEQWKIVWKFWIDLFKELKVYAEFELFNEAGTYISDQWINDAKRFFLSQGVKEYQIQLDFMAPRNLAGVINWRKNIISFHAVSFISDYEWLKKWGYLEVENVFLSDDGGSKTDGIPQGIYYFPDGRTAYRRRAIQQIIEFTEFMKDKPVGVSFLDFHHWGHIMNKKWYGCPSYPLSWVTRNTEKTLRPDWSLFNFTLFETIGKILYIESEEPGPIINPPKTEPLPVIKKNHFFGPKFFSINKKYLKLIFYLILAIATLRILFPGG